MVVDALRIPDQGVAPVTWYQMSIRSTLVALIVVFATAGIFITTTDSYAASTKKKGAVASLPDVVARVNGVPISGNDLAKEIVNYTRRKSSGHHGQSAPEKPAELQKVVLNQMIGAELLYQLAQKTPFPDKDKRIQDAIAELRNRFASEAEYHTALKEQGLDAAGLKQLVTFNVVLENYVKTVVMPAQMPTEGEIATMYRDNPETFSRPEQVRARHILISVAATASDADRQKARATIEDLAQQIKKGASFEALAKANSSCPSSKQGGDLSFFGRGQMVKPFEDAAFSLPVGGTSGVVETQFGYHLIQVTDKRPAGAVPLAEVRGMIVETLQQQKVGKALDDLLVSERKQAKVEIFLK